MRKTTPLLSLSLRRRLGIAAPCPWGRRPIASRADAVRAVAEESTPGSFTRPTHHDRARYMTAAWMQHAEQSDQQSAVPLSTSVSQEEREVASAVRLVVPQRFPVLVRYHNFAYDVRRLVKSFRDRSQLLSNVVGETRGDVQGPTTVSDGASSASSDSAVEREQRGGSLLSTESAVSPHPREPHLWQDYRFEMQYPSPGGQALDAQFVPQQYRGGGFGHGRTAAAGDSSSNRLMAITLRSVVDGNHFTIFGDGTVVAFGSGDAEDRSYLRMLATGTDALTTHPSEYDDDLGVSHWDSQMNVDDETIALADKVLLDKRKSVLAMDLKRLERVLLPFELPKDLLLQVGAGGAGGDQDDGLSIAFSFTTALEVERSGDDGHLDEALPQPPRDAAGEPLSYVDQSYWYLIILQKASPAEMMPFAFCLCELVQLRALALLLEPLAQRASAWQTQLHKHGVISVHVREARKAKAQVLRISARLSKLGMTRHRVFWESHFASSRAVFQESCARLEVFAVHDAFKARVDSVASTLSYICDEAHSDTNHRLEYVIIVLISIEVLMSLHLHPILWTTPEEGEGDGNLSTGQS